MKALALILVFISTIAIVLAIDQYLFCPVYIFNPPIEFSGDSLYNPYSGIEKSHWVKCNFHAHSHCWDGITNGKGSPSDVTSVYRKLHYGVYEVSNYESILNPARPGKEFIHAYEHGYNLGKVHQLVLGSSGVCFKDYFFPQTTSNKQYILNLLKDTRKTLVILNHPQLRTAYHKDDVQLLSSIRCMEVLNPSRISSALWDDALSAGKPVFVVGDDDVHNVFDSSLVGRMFTMLNLPNISEYNILSALENGKSYAESLDRHTVLKERRGEDIKLPALDNFSLNGNVLKIRFNERAKNITVFGEDGKVLKEVTNSDTLSYPIAKNIPYVRETATFDSANQIFLNPVFRFKKQPFTKSGLYINYHETFYFRLVGIMMLLMWFSGPVSLLLFKKKLNHS